MWRGKPLSSPELRNLSMQLEDVGYESVLLPFHSECSDYLIKSAGALVSGHKLKYMIALRPYHLSAQYCAMIAQGFNDIEKDRLMFNWIAGDYHNRSDEKPQRDVYGESHNIDNIEKRKQFLRDFVLEFSNNKIITSKPEMVFSGYSDFTIETASMFKSTTLCMIDDYRKNIDRFKEIQKIMVSVCVVILKPNEGVENYKEKIFSINPRSIDTTIFGDTDTVKQRLLELENEGITDILLHTKRPEFEHISSQDNDNNDILVNELVKQIIGGSKNV